jgi:hypothetical protein
MVGPIEAPSRLAAPFAVLHCAPMNRPLHAPRDCAAKGATGAFAAIGGTSTKTSTTKTT